ncbi:unnamed protein product [Bursaphelenchus xylophilus]|uniref:(pine wood nematode) hypothetical protein n=1 Tax=Bursaphelenchus xylophilus TaxID=6326 RepID=A0A1I7RY98_BURXY|nr:unnamed protein product [Bursaphelenchus xylophilus]CAG9085492.1 unnamed protein product [Bursaphelenchus xylophilus]
MANKFNQTLGTFDERLKISVDYLKDSNFSTIFESSVESFFQTQTPVFDKSLLVFDKLQKTNDLKEYVSNVRKNIKLFDVYSFNE